MQKMDKTVAKKKNCKQKKLVCVSSHLRTLHFLDFIDRRLKVVCVYVAFFRGPGECPAVATVTSASCLLLLLRLAFLPRPSPADPAPKAGSHGRQTEAATFFVDGTFPRVWHKYSCSNCSDKVSNTKITKNIWPLHIEEEQISPTLMADTALKEAVDWLFVRGSIVSRFDVIRQMRLILVTFHTKVALMSLLLVWHGLCALIL